MPRASATSRVLATVLFTDIVGSTDLAAKLGDQGWDEIRGRHNAIVRGLLRRFHGREIDTAGDGFFATFDQPANGVRCAAEIVRAVGAIGLEVRAGLHFGECEFRRNTVTGIAVHIGARVAALAGPGEVLVTGTLREVISGAGLWFRDRGVQSLKGVPEHWPVFALDFGRAPVDVATLVPAAPEGGGRPAPTRRLPRWLLPVAAALVAMVVALVALVRLGDRGASRRTTTPRSALVAVPAGSAVQVHGESGKVLTKPRLAQPGPMAAGAGGLWMLFGATDVFNGFHLALLDPATGATKKAFGEHYFSLAIAGRSVWVVQGRGEIESGSGRPFVEQIDPSTFHVVRREALPRSDGSARMAASGDDLWVVTYQGELAHFNGLTGERLGDVLHLGLTADDVAASEGAAWVLDKQRGRVVRIDGATSAVSTVDLSGAPTKIAAGQDGAWVIDNLANTATLIDPSGTRVLSTVGVGGEPTDIAVGLDAVWVADAGTHALYRIDPITHEVRPFNVRGPVHYLALDEQAGTIWLSAQECPPGRCL